MSRSYKGVRPKANRVYSVNNVQDIYGVCRNTVSNWVRSGLLPSVGVGQQIFRGAELVRFHADRIARIKVNLRKGEFKCTGCKAAVFPDCSVLSFVAIKNGGTMARGQCPDCSAILVKILGETECNAIKNCMNTNTSLYSIDEGKEVMHGGVGKIRESESLIRYNVNDRIIFNWQIYAGRFDTKTVDIHLSAIRDFERVTKGMPFHLIKTDAAAAYRDKLIERGKLAKGEGGSSKSTIRHRASHLSRFFEWLCKQDGHRRMNKSIPEYFKLPKGITAQAMQAPPRLFPTIDEAISMASEMPSRTIRERRNRAIFALAFVTGFRASALISLRLRHIDVQGKRAFQDGADVRAKNGRSYTANWFPRTEKMQQFLVAWIDEIQSIGVSQDDALFPAARHLARPFRLSQKNRPSIEPMRTQVAVTEAFIRASSHSTLNYSPHSARHCLAALGEQICRSSEEKKAWSLNLGHSSEQVTQSHYAKVSEVRKCEIFEGFSENNLWTDEEKDLMLDYHEHRLHLGTPEFQRAKLMIAKRAGTM